MYRICIVDTRGALPSDPRLNTIVKVNYINIIFKSPLYNIILPPDYARHSGSSPFTISQRSFSLWIDSSGLQSRWPGGQKWESSAADSGLVSPHPAQLQPSFRSAQTAHRLQRSGIIIDKSFINNFHSEFFYLEQFGTKSGAQKGKDAVGMTLKNIAKQFKVMTSSFRFFLKFI